MYINTESQEHNITNILGNVKDHYHQARFELETKKEIAHEDINVLARKAHLWMVLDLICSNVETSKAEAMACKQMSYVQPSHPCQDQHLSWKTSVQSK